MPVALMGFGTLQSFPLPEIGTPFSFPSRHAVARELIEASVAGRFARPESSTSRVSSLWKSVHTPSGITRKAQPLLSWV
jgi:hypothetical protein